MIIYGDSHYESTLEILKAQIEQKVVDALENPSLDKLRTLLIQAGQMEQAAQDGGYFAECQQLTDDIARAFFAAYDDSAETALERWPVALKTRDETLSEVLNVKVPEGFAFYALFPEQYILAARDWAAQQQSRGGVLVVGLRSIGTSLSALVSATLQSQGYDVQRLTVRPTGPPFERHIEIGDIGDLRQGLERALIVDEGPGLSGSSMVAVGEALVQAGFPRSGIAFLPGHGGSPGQMGSESVQQWWATTPRFATPLTTVRWNDRTLAQKLAARTTDLVGETIERVEDVGGGLWRRFVYENPAEFPPVAATFECPKFLCFSRSGPVVLWKFGGLATLQKGETGAEAMLGETNALSQSGWTSPALGMESGFIATSWMGGKALRRGEATPEFVAHAASYLQASSGEPLSPEEQRRSLQLMSEWLYWNTWEALGEKFAERTRSSSERALTSGADIPYPTYGDGRMMPHEWRELETGRYCKLDCCGHSTDHTVVGRQTLAWDMAGLVIEWNFDSKQIELLLSALKAKSAITFAPDLLRFHYLGYAAFRLGLFTMAGSSDEAESERQQREIDFYRQALRRWIE